MKDRLIPASRTHYPSVCKLSFVCLVEHHLFVVSILHETRKNWVIEPLARSPKVCIDSRFLCCNCSDVIHALEKAKSALRGKLLGAMTGAYMKIYGYNVSETRKYLYRRNKVIKKTVSRIHDGAMNDS